MIPYQLPKSQQQPDPIPIKTPKPNTPAFGYYIHRPTLDGMIQKLLQLDADDFVSIGILWGIEVRVLLKIFEKELYNSYYSQ
jgi:hypothetical protein